MEKVDIYNAAGEKTGRVINRDDSLAEGERILIVHLCLFNSRGEMLIQRRSLKKDRYPGRWDLSAGGFALSGESSLDAVSREAKEEIGLALRPADIRFAFTEPFFYVLDDFYIACSNRDSTDFPIQKDELEAVKWAAPEDILTMLHSGQLVDYPESVLERVFTLAAPLEKIRFKQT